MIDTSCLVCDGVSVSAHTVADGGGLEHDAIRGTSFVEVSSWAVRGFHRLVRHGASHPPSLTPLARFLAC